MKSFLEAPGYYATFNSTSLTECLGPGSAAKGEGGQRQGRRLRGSHKASSRPVWWVAVGRAPSQGPPPEKGKAGGVGSEIDPKGKQSNKQPGEWEEPTGLDLGFREGWGKARICKAVEGSACRCPQEWVGSWVQINAKLV